VREESKTIIRLRVAPDIQLAGYPANFLPDIRYPAEYLTSKISSKNLKHQQNLLTFFIAIHSFFQHIEKVLVYVML